MQSPLIALLREALGGQSRPEADGALSDWGAADVDWVIETGLAPLLWARVKGDASAFDQDRQTLRAADLTAHLYSDATFDCLDEILAAASAADIDLVLLKGVCVAQCYYPVRHWRPMRDIDLLVRPEQQQRLESTLRELGYVQQGSQPAEFFVGHQHSMPFFRNDPPCWIEVHTALFRAGTRAAAVPDFATPRLFEDSVVCAGAGVRCLDPAVQLVYTAVHWGSKLTQVGGLFPVLDAMLLIDKARLDWSRVAGISRHPTAARYLYLLLSYLRRHALADIPNEIWRSLAAGQRSIGGSGVRLLHGIIDRHLLQGRPFQGLSSEALVNVRWETLLSEDPAWVKWIKLPWRTLFPPGHADRYDPRRQLRRLKVFWRNGV